MSKKITFKEIVTNGVRLNVAQSGLKKGKLVILLHGFPEFWYGWKEQISQLAEAGFNVWAPDQRGYNLSDKPKSLASYQLDELAKDILGLISAAGQEKACIAGHDWGAMVAWWLGICYPEHVEKLAILNVPHPAVFRRTLLTSPEQMRRSLYAMFFQIPGLPEAILRNKDWELSVRTLRGTSHDGVFTEEDIEQYRRSWWQKGAMTSMLNWYRAYFRLPPHLPADDRVHVPALILWGAKDSALSQRMVQPSADKCDQVRLVLFGDATHWVQHEEAWKISQELIEFFG